ncbi:MAG: DUF1566 domain-containing protein [Desulfobacterales bacterium]|nr:DUF1566 domain-containing protein [Desulfobacterales bacterium]
MIRTVKTIALAILLFFWLVTNTIAGPVPDTGQAKCYDENYYTDIPCPQPGEAFYGQDGNHTINPQSYTKLDATGNDLPSNATEWGMVRDNVTGLIWEVKTDDGSVHDKDSTYTWCDTNPATNGGNAGTCGDGTDTEDFINALNTAGFGGSPDWRMPTKEELRSIVNYGRDHPAIDSVFFPDTVMSSYWSSTRLGNIDVWHVNFNDGISRGDLDTLSLYVRAVRGRQSFANARYTNNGDGTVTDSTTGLMWQQAKASGEQTRAQAFFYTESLALGGYDDWRLPTIKELASLANFDRRNPAVDVTYFPDTVSSYYWSSTTYAGDTSNAWRVDFYDGYVINGNKSFSYYVRAVRAGQNRLLDHLVISVPAQAAHWEIGELKTIAWGTAGIAGNVKITLSRQGGKPGTFTEVIAESVANTGTHDWTVVGPESVNSALRIESLADTTKGTTQSLFTIAQFQKASITAVKWGDPAHYQMTLIGQYMDGVFPLDAVWSSSDTSVATISNNVLTAVKNGYVQVSAVFGGNTYTKDIFVFTTNDAAEIEPNSTKAAANAMAVGRFYKGKLGTGDEDWFKFTLSSASLVDLAFLSYSSTADVKVDLFSTTDVLQASVTSTNGESLNLGVGLPAGDYYVRLSSVGDVDTANSYVLTWKDMGALPAKTAIPLALTETKTGKIYSLADQTDFTFTLASDQGIVVTFTPGSQTAKYHLSLLDNANAVIDQIECLNQAAVSLAATYAAGNYTLRVTPVDVIDVNNDFSVQLASSTIQREQEPNNATTQAGTLDIAQSVTGRLSGNSDIDYYTFTLPNTRYLDMTFAAPGSAKSFSIVFYRESDGSPINGIDVANGQSVTLPLGLAPGKYYLAVKSDGVNADTINYYTVSFADSSQTNLEMEPNNSWGQANEIGKTTPLKGIINSTSDKDYFGFYLTEDAFFTVQFTPSSTTGDYKVSIVDEKETVLDSFTSLNGAAQSTEIYQVVGNYYIKVEADGDIDQFNPYQVSLSTTVDVEAPKRYPVTTAKPAGGIYGKAVSVTLTANQTATIYYSTDGTTPTTSSLTYTTPISVSANTILKYFAVNAKGNQETAIRTQKYTIMTNGWIDVAAGGNHTIALRSNGTLWAWGENAAGQLGDGSVNNRNSPVQVGMDTKWVSVASGGIHSLAIKSDGTLWAWGDNGSGQLGDGTTERQGAPIQVGADTDWVAIAAGDYYSIALKSNGTLWAWGDNYSGQLGDGTTTDKSSPVKIGTDTNWVTVTTGGQTMFVHTLALKSDGSLWAWGENGSSQLGDGTTTNKNSPVQIGGSTDWVAIAAGHDHSLGLKSDGSLWAWGVNGSGQLGDGTIITKNSPVKIGTGTDWVAIAAGVNHSHALKSDGSLWAWGTNEFNRLGDGTSTQQNTPSQIGTNTTWAAISAGRSHAFALKADGALWGWGLNMSGQVGINNFMPYVSAPAEVVFSGTIQINANAQYTTSPNVTLTLSCTDTANCSKMQFSNDGSSWSPEEDYADTKSWSLSPDDGTKTVYARFSGATGTWSEAVTDTIIIDATLPLIAGLSDDETPIKSKTWSWDASDASAVTYRFLIDQNATWNNPSGNYANVKTVTKDTGDGVWYLHVQAKDAADNESDVITVSAVLDTTPPLATISGTPESPTSKTDAVLTIGGADVTAYKYKLNSGSYSSERTLTTLVSMSSLADDTYTVEVIGRDALGNWQSTSSPTVASWTVDTTVLAPQDMALATGDDTGGSNSDNITSLTSGLTITGAGENGATVQLFDGENEIPGATKVVSGGTFSIDISLSEGQHRITAKQTNTAGDTSTASGALNILIDTAAPSPPEHLDLAAADDSGDSNEDNITKNTSALTIAGQGENGTMVHLYDNDSVIPNATAVVSGGTFSIDISLSEGQHRLSAKQTDTAGNVSVSSFELEITVDTTPPVLTATPPGTEGPFNSFKNISIISSDGTAKIYYNPHGLDPVTNGYLYFSLLNITLSTQVKFYGIDEAGNQSKVQTEKYVLDFVPPSAPVIDPSNNTDEGNNSLPTFAWQAVSDAHHYVLQYADNINFNSPAQFTELTSTSYTLTEHLSSGGLWYWRVRAVDAAGNNSEWATFQYHFINDNSIRKAIVVAGSGPYPGNALWTATVAIADKAFDTLFNRGYRSDNIKYLSHQSYSENPNVDAVATKAGLETAITQWATDADEFVLYLNGHGGKGTFRISEHEDVTASQLDAWLDVLQHQRNIKVIVIYEACYSGSFLPVLAATGDQVRVLISSADADQQAWLVTDGTVSFSWPFWTRTGAGFNVYDAFANATKSISFGYRQTPMIDTNGDGKFNEKADKLYASNVYIGYKAVSAAEFPEISAVSPTKFLIDETTATIFAEGVTGATSIVRVWATVLRPDFDPGSPDAPVTYLPEFELTDRGGNRYEGIYNNFNLDGRYILTIYAKDDKDLLSEPMQIRVYKNVILGNINKALISSWNLISLYLDPPDTSINSVLSNIKTDIVSTWKWVNGNWAVWLPSETDQGAAYAASKGFSQMTTITSGEGFWVNSSIPQTLTVSGTQPADTSNSLSSGWNLVGLKSESGKSVTDLISGNKANITSIWKWDNGTWAVYLPGQDTATYAAGKGFGVLSNIDPGEGFWVNANQAVVLP